MSTIDVRVSEAPIGLEDLVGVAPDPGHGAQNIFTGVVRQSNLGRQVVSVSYDAFVPLAERALEEICEEARQKWGANLELRVRHRIGTLKVGEMSVLIAVGLPHRAESYLASRYVIEQIKVRVPIWKKETYVDGESEWLKGHALCSHGHEEVASTAAVAHDDCNDERSRYSRQLALAEIGARGQKRLADASVLCVGVGGLGSPVALYLAAAGVGRIGLVDHDKVDVSNLQRQVLFQTPDRGRLKVDVAAERLRALNPNVKIDAHAERLSADNAERLLAPYSLILDGTDNFAAKFLVSDAAFKFGKPLITASVSGTEGQLLLVPGGASACYRCVFARDPGAGVRNCAEAGVLGPWVGVVGSWQALEAIRLIAAEVPETASRLSIFDATTGETTRFAVARREDCPTCSRPREDIVLSATELSRATCATPRDPKAIWLDVREDHEWAAGHVPGALHWPLQRIEAGQLPDLQSDSTIIVYCASGVRSARALKLLVARGFTKVHNHEAGFHGGETAWS